MHRYIGELYAYDFINNLGFMIALVCNLFLIRAKLKVPTLYAKCLGEIVSRKSAKVGKVVFVFITILELFLSSRQVLNAAVFNEWFGNLMGTGFNYFGALFTTPIIILLVSIVFLVNPLKNSDILTMVAPIFLFFVRIACYCNGCCWGVEWEYGPYNHSPYHPGRQVPVQAIEAFFVMAIFIFLLIYRKKAKPGTIFPLYMILYSATRFPIEFFSAASEKVYGSFNAYHFLCIAGVVYGFIMLLIVKLFGEKISDAFENLQKNIEEQMEIKKEMRKQKIADENTRLKAEKNERLEKAKIAREKASVKYKK